LALEQELALVAVEIEEVMDQELEM